MSMASRSKKTLRSIPGYEGDSISIRNSVIRINLKIVTGGGDDYVSIDTAHMGGNTAILTGAGDDYTPLRKVHFSDVFRLLSGAGDDVVSLSEVHFLQKRQRQNRWWRRCTTQHIRCCQGTYALFAGAGRDL